MAQYIIDGNDNKIISKFDFTGILTTKALFPNHWKDYLKRKKGVKCCLEHKYNLHDNSSLVRLIFTRFLVKVLTRVADGDLFMFPGGTKTHMTLKPIKEDQAKKLRQAGLFKNIDIVKANFKIPRFTIDFGPYSRKFDFRVYVPRHLEDRSFRNAENGQIPWMNMPKTFDRDV